MSEVEYMRQEPQESNHEYSSRFQKMRREAEMDGTQFAVTYFASLKPSVKSAAQLVISSHLNANLPNSINQIIDLVLASGEDSAFSLKHSYKRNHLIDDDHVPRKFNTNKALSDPNTTAQPRRFIPAMIKIACDC